MCIPGKYVFLCCSIFLNMCGNDLSLRLVDTDGNTINHVTQGVPFVLSVVARGQAGTLGEPVIDHVDQLSIFQRRPVVASMSFVNGVQSVSKKYSFVARIDHCGSYALGPARIVEGNRLIRSNALAFDVVKDSLEQKESTLLLLVQPNKKIIYVGEQLLLDVRICWSDRVRQAALEQCVLPQAAVYVLGQPEQERYEYQKKIWQCLHYVLVIYPKKSGELLIPRLTAQCQVEREEQSFLAHFFGPSLERTFVHSVPIAINVRSLPGPTITVDGVGSFQNFLMMADHAVIGQSEAVTVTLGITGDGDTGNLLTGLRGIGDDVRLYESATQVQCDPGRRGFFTKKREWVVQALRAGIITIPAQTFTYFDPQCVRYNILRTAPITVAVRADVALVKREIRLGKSWPLPQEIPMNWFMLMLLLGVAGLFVGYVWQLWRLMPAHFGYRALKRMVEHGVKKHDYITVYDAWLLFFADHDHITIEQMSLKKMVDFGEKMFNNKQLIDQWKRYAMRLESAAFDREHATMYEVLGDESMLWLRKVKKCL